MRLDKTQKLVAATVGLPKKPAAPQNRDLLPVLYGMKAYMGVTRMNWFGSRKPTFDESGSLQDVQLVENALRSGRAFEPIVRKYHAMVFAVALAHLRDAESAEDLAQEVFVRAFLHLSRRRTQHSMTSPSPAGGGLLVRTAAKL